jgi:hypothetical protein
VVRRPFLGDLFGVVGGGGEAGLGVSVAARCGPGGPFLPGELARRVGLGRGFRPQLAPVRCGALRHGWRDDKLGPFFLVKVS